MGVSAQMVICLIQLWHDLPTILLTTGQVAHILHLHVSTVRQWESQGILRARRIGPRGDRRFEQNVILRLISNTGNENNGRQ